MTRANTVVTRSFGEMFPGTTSAYTQGKLGVELPDNYLELVGGAARNEFRLINVRILPGEHFEALSYPDSISEKIVSVTLTPGSGGNGPVYGVVGIEILTPEDVAS
jgi:hypothetical protein